MVNGQCVRVRTKNIIYLYPYQFVCVYLNILEHGLMLWIIITLLVLLGINLLAFSISSCFFQCSIHKTKVDKKTTRIWTEISSCNFCS